MFWEWSTAQHLLNKLIRNPVKEFHEFQQRKRQRWQRHDRDDPARLLSSKKACCGNCPLCQGFVSIEKWSPHGAARCPRCGGRIRELEPLGPEDIESELRGSAGP